MNAPGLGSPRFGPGAPAGLAVAPRPHTVGSAVPHGRSGPIGAWGPIIAVRPGPVGAGSGVEDDGQGRGSSRAASALGRY